ncbi:MAG: hypothetical protein ACLSAH_03660 [Bilophila wadsworthia]
MRRYEAAANACGASISDNPSPGNIHDGLITDAIKSAGAAKKGGKAPISAGSITRNPCRTPGCPSSVRRATTWKP